MEGFGGNGRLVAIFLKIPIVNAGSRGMEKLQTASLSTIHDMASIMAHENLECMKSYIRQSSKKGNQSQCHVRLFQPMVR